MLAAKMKSADPADLAKEIVAEIPLDEICQDQGLMNAFLAEMFLAISRASTKERRRQRQAEGIAAAKARGVRFGPKSPPLPDNFDEVRFAWRRGEFNLITAAQLCGMPKSTFHNAVQRAEEIDSMEGGEGRDAEQTQAESNQGRTSNPLRYHQSPSLPNARAGRVI